MTAHPCGLSPRALLPAFLLAFAGGCMLGGGSDTETLKGAVVMPSGLPSAGARIKLFPVDYDPSSPDSSRMARTVLTDSAGRFAFTGLGGGYYSVVAHDADASLWSFADSLHPRQLAKPLVLGRARVFELSLHAGSASGPLMQGEIYFPGTDILVRCDGVSTCLTDSIPPGVERLAWRSSTGETGEFIVLPGTSDTLRLRVYSGGGMVQ